ncbi:LuxR C-terminal-related transcriptional regulator [Geodermatophilus sp. SYSU D00525]
MGVDPLAPPHEGAVRLLPVRPVADLYGERSVPSLLRRLLVLTGDLLGTVAGSISIVDAAEGQYTKVAEIGVPCQLGCRFPLAEGVTGRAVARRRPVVVDEYAALGTGHLPPGHPAAHGTAVAVPLWWRGEVVGVNVAFAGQPRRLTAEEVDAVEQLTQVAVPALVRAAASDPLLDRLLRREHAADHVPPSAVPGVPARATVEACPLTRREQQVLGLLAIGLSDREVAARLVISPKTVHKHVGAVLRKSGTASRTAAVVRALQRGWLPPDGSRAGDGQPSPYGGRRRAP